MACMLVISPQCLILWGFDGISIVLAHAFFKTFHSTFNSHTGDTCALDLRQQQKEDNVQIVPHTLVSSLGMLFSLPKNPKVSGLHKLEKLIMFCNFTSHFFTWLRSRYRLDLVDCESWIGLEEAELVSIGRSIEQNHT